MIVTFKWALPFKQTNEFLISSKVRMSEMPRISIRPSILRSHCIYNNITSELPFERNSGRTSKDQRASETQLTAIEHSKVHCCASQGSTEKQRPEGTKLPASFPMSTLTAGTRPSEKAAARVWCVLQREEQPCRHPSWLTKTRARSVYEEGLHGCSPHP